MKSHIRILILVGASLFISNSAFSQSLLNRIKQKTKDKLEKRLEDKVDEGIDKSLDNLENSVDSMVSSEDSGTDPRVSQEEKNQQRMNRMMKGLGLSGEPVPHEDSYTFDEAVEMHIESYDSNEKQTTNGNFITYLNPSSGDLAYKMISGNVGENEQGMFIIDTKNKAVILLNDKDGEKTGLIYGMGTFFEDMKDSINENMENEEMPENMLDSPYVTKTGKTKNIAGYKCEQYLYNTEGEESEIWITDELKTSSKDFFSTIFKASVYMNGMGYGYVMESSYKDKTNGDTSFMQVTRVDKNSKETFDLSSYQITNLGSFQMPAGEDE